MKTENKRADADRSAAGKAGVGEPFAMMAQPASPWLRGREAVAEYLGGVSIKSVDKWISRGVLPVVRLPAGRLTLFRRADVDRALEKFTADARA